MPPFRFMRGLEEPGDVSALEGDKPSCKIKKVLQDEPVNGRGDGNTAPDAMWVGSYRDRVALRAERSGGGDGRVYCITFTAKDSKGNTCTSTVEVGVPHDMGRGSTPVNSGCRYNSFED